MKSWHKLLKSQGVPPVDGCGLIREYLFGGRPEVLVEMTSEGLEYFSEILAFMG